MLKEQATLFRRLMIFGDLCIVLLGFLLGYFILSAAHTLRPLGDYIGFLPVLIIIWGVILYGLGAYRSFRTKKVTENIFIILKAAFLSFIVFASYLYLFKIEDISRLFIVSALLSASVLMFLEKTVIIYFLWHLRKKNYNIRDLLIIGTGPRAQAFIDTVHQHAEWGLHIMGIVDEDPSKKGEVVSGHEVLGVFKDVPDIVHNNVVDEIVFVVPRSWLTRMAELISFCETEGIKVSIAVDLFTPSFSRIKQSDLNGFPLLSIESTPDKLWHLLFKRLFDVVSSALGIIILSPVLIIVPAIIKATSEGPVFFRQERCSLNGRIFTLYKFRTMVKDAEDRIEGLMEKNEMNGPAFKMENDPRLTPIGNFMRKTSIDELPQLWNVFKGEMSIVGPRPPLPKEVNSYDSWHRRRLKMRPGITCLWQAGGRNKINAFHEWVKLDLKYIDNWSLGLDFKILFKTIPAVLFFKGAK